MQVTANVAVNKAPNGATSTGIPGVKPNGSNGDQPVSFSELGQQVEQQTNQQPGTDEATVALEAQLQSAEQPQQPSPEELALQVEQLLAQAAKPEGAQVPAEAVMPPEALKAAMAGQAMLAAQGLPGEPGQAQLPEQMQSLTQQSAMPGANVTANAMPAANAAAMAATAMPLSKEAQQLAADALLAGKESLPQMKAMALPQEAMLANKEMLGSLDSALVEKLAVASQANSTMPVHSAMSSNFNMLTQAAMQSSSSAAASAQAQPQQFQASVDITEPEWGRDLVDQLRSRMQLSKTDQIQHAHVRLDPPELGRLEVSLRMEGDKVSVHFTAAHPQLREALAANADRLRFDFDGSQMQLTDVSVSSGMYQQSRQQSGSDDEPGVMANHIVAQPDDATSSMSAPGLDSRYESMV